MTSLRLERDGDVLRITLSRPAARNAFDAGTALRIGLVHEVADDLAGALDRVLRELRTAAPRATRHAKRLIGERPDGPETARRIAERRASAEGREGLQAFLEGRVPGQPGFASWTPPAD